MFDLSKWHAVSPFSKNWRDLDRETLIFYDCPQACQSTDHGKKYLELLLEETSEEDYWLIVEVDPAIDLSDDNLSWKPLFQQAEQVYVARWYGRNNYSMYVGRGSEVPDDFLPDD